MNNCIRKGFALTLSLILILTSMMGSFTAATTNPLPLSSAFKYFEKLPKDQVSLYVKDLTSGKSYGLNENFVNKDEEAGMMGASVVKLHLAYYGVKSIEKGTYKWDQTYKDPVSGRKFTIRNEMSKMITVSDNGSFNTLLRFFKPEAINAGLADLLMPNTKVHAELGPAGDGWSAANNRKRYGTTKGGRINAYETAVMLEDIYKNKEKIDMKVLHNFMLKVSNKDRIPSAVGKSIVVAHKTGTMSDKDGVFDDVGIVYGKNGNYIVCVLVQKQKASIDKETRKAVKLAFDYMEKSIR